MSPAPIFSFERTTPSAHRKDVVDIHEASASQAYAHIFSDPFPRDESEQRWESFAGPCILARDEQGASAAFMAWEGEELSALYVRPGFERQGLGAALMDLLPEGVNRLWVLEENASARAFYEKRGWKATGETKSPWGVVELRYALS